MAGRTRWWTLAGLTAACVTTLARGQDNAAEASSSATPGEGAAASAPAQPPAPALTAQSESQPQSQPGDSSWADADEILNTPIKPAQPSTPPPDPNAVPPPRWLFKGGARIGANVKHVVAYVQPWAGPGVGGGFEYTQWKSPTLQLGVSGGLSLGAHDDGGGPLTYEVMGNVRWVRHRTARFTGMWVLNVGIQSILVVPVPEVTGGAAFSYVATQSETWQVNLGGEAAAGLSFFRPKVAGGLTSDFIYHLGKNAWVGLRLQASGELTVAIISNEVGGSVGALGMYSMTL